MNFFESLLALMVVAILLLQVARRVHVPYPAILAAAGVAVAAIPGAPEIAIDPPTVLALFIAPILVDAAYDFPLGAARKLMAPLIVLAVIAVLATAAAVAAIGWLTIGLPLAAALVLGAIVAPPDAAAATAVVANLPVERRLDAVLKGESMFNDATALLLFGAALTIQTRGGFDAATALQLGLAVPGGIAFGVAAGYATYRLNPYVANTVGGTLLQFCQTFVTWIIAERLHLSAVLAVVASAMTIAALNKRADSPRMRVHSFAVWTTVVFLLNVLAFLLMGLQAHRIVAGMGTAELTRALWFSAAVVAGVIAVRLVVAFGYRFVIVRRHRAGRGPAPISTAETLLMGWAGMRGLVTLATAYALPADFPERDTVVLAAFAVVLATLVVQGMTLGPLIRWFDIGREAEAAAELVEARRALNAAALARLADEPGEEADRLRALYRTVGQGLADPAGAHALDRQHGLSLAAVLAQRAQLDRLRDEHRVGTDSYLALQEDLDWKQLSILGDDESRIREM